MTEKHARDFVEILGATTPGPLGVTGKPVPSEAEVIRLIDRLVTLLYFGYFPGARGSADWDEQVEKLLNEARTLFTEQLELAAQMENRTVEPAPPAPPTGEVVNRFFSQLPVIRRKLVFDVAAAFDGDPAAKSFAEIILSYPGLRAITIYRLAHELLTLGVELIPRMMTEYAHHRTGIDIHPGARIGESFFIDHGTGVVIGETADIGRNVKIYQGVTLGALSFPKDERGKIIRDAKRHPTIEDDVVIYAGATILGGGTVIGRGSVIGGNTWVTHSIPPRSRVTTNPQEQKIETKP